MRLHETFEVSTLKTNTKPIRSLSECCIYCKTNMQPWNTQLFNKHTFPFGQGTLPLAVEKMTSLPRSLATELLATSCVAQSNIHFCKMRMWMPLVARSFPQRTVLVIYQHQKSHMGATKTSFQRLDEVRNRQQLLCAIHLRHVGPFGFAAGILNHKLYALQERKPRNLTKSSNGANENDVFLGMTGKWDARIFCQRFSVSRRFSRCFFFCFGRSKGNAVGWPRILEAGRKLGFNGFKSAVFARVGFVPSSLSRRQEALLAPLHGLFYLALQVICPI